MRQAWKEAPAHFLSFFAMQSPELFDGGSVTEKVDVYSYGIMLWEMLTGKVPWGDVPSPMQIIYYVGVLQQRPPLPPMCQPALRELIQACWSEAPSSRPSFKEILARLRELQAVVQADGLQQFTMLEPVAEEASEEAVGGVDEGDVGSEEAGTATASSTFDMVAMNSYASSTTNTTVLEQSGPLTASTGTAAA
jgi:serine/threonine protein kinase